MLNYPKTKQSVAGAGFSLRKIMVNNTLRSQKGAFTLIAVMAAFTIMAIVMGTFFTAERVEQTMEIRTEQEAQAFWLAEAAVEVFKQRSRTGNFDDLFSLQVDGLPGTIAYDWNQGVNPPTLTVTGTFNGITKTLQLEKVMSSILNYSFFDRGDIPTAPSVGTFGNGVKIIPFNNLTLRGNMYSGGNNLYLGTTNIATTITIDGSAKFQIFSGDLKTDKDFMGNDLIPGRISPAIIDLDDTDPDDQVKLNQPQAKVDNMDNMFAEYRQKANAGQGYNITDINIPNGVVSDTSMHNEAYGNNEFGVKLIDINKVPPASWPTNSFVYSDKPILILNGDKLKDRKEDLMIVSNGDIYIQGDFKTDDNKGAVLITSGRFFFVSDNYQGDNSDFYLNRQAGKGGDTDGYTMTVEAAMIDGVPSFCTSSWVTDYNGTPSDNTDDVYRQSGTSVGTMTTPYTPPPGNLSPCGFGLLENWTSTGSNPLKLHIKGNMIHLRNAQMNENDLDNNGRDDITDALLYTDANGDGIDDNPPYGKIPLDWIVAQSYNPPEREFEYVSKHGASGRAYDSLLPKVFSWREK